MPDIAKDYAERDFQRHQSNNYFRRGDRVIAVGNDVRGDCKMENGVTFFVTSTAGINTSTTTIQGFSR
jgi:hypothetical protein